MGGSPTLRGVAHRDDQIPRLVEAFGDPVLSASSAKEKHPANDRGIPAPVMHIDQPSIDFRFSLLVPVTNAAVQARGEHLGQVCRNQHKPAPGREQVPRATPAEAA